MRFAHPARPALFDRFDLTIAAGETITLQVQTVAEQPDAPRVLSLSVRPQPEREFLILRKDDGSYVGEDDIERFSDVYGRVKSPERA